jgi:hypothetical protein
MSRLQSLTMSAHTVCNAGYIIARYISRLDTQLSLPYACSVLENLHFRFCIEKHTDLTETQNGRDLTAINTIVLLVYAMELRVVARISWFFALKFWINPTDVALRSYRSPDAEHVDYSDSTRVLTRTLYVLFYIVLITLDFLHLHHTPREIVCLCRQLPATTNVCKTRGCNYGFWAPDD